MLNIFQIKYEILLREWDRVSETIGRLDGFIFILKGWAVAVTSASLAYAYAHRDAVVAFGIIIPILVIWLIDSMLKAIQLIFIDRAEEIEIYLSSKEFEEDFEMGKLPRIDIPLVSRKRRINITLCNKMKLLVNTSTVPGVLSAYAALISLCVIVGGVICLIGPSRSP